MKVIIALAFCVLTASAAPKGGSDRSAFFCGVCTALVGAAENAGIQNEQQLENYVDQYCMQLGNFVGSLCKGAVNALIPDLFQYIQQNLPPQTVCSKVGLCSSRMMLTEVGNSLFCGVCEELIGAAENAGIQSESALENLVNQFCDKLGFLSGLCKGAVDALIPDLFNYIKQNLPPATVCAKVHLCSGMAKSQLPAAAAADLSVRSGPFCQYCEMAINEVKQLLENYVPNIVNDVEALCNKLPGQEGQICNMLVSQYLQMLIDKLVGMLDADKACAAMKLCSVSASVSRNSADMTLAQLDINLGGLECNFCKMLFQFIDDNLFGEDAENIIFQDLEKVCQLIPNQDYQQKCIGILGTYGQMIVNYLKGLIAPDHMCPLIKMCPSS